MLTDITVAQNAETKATIGLDHLTIDGNGKLLAFNSGNIYKADSFGSDWTFKNEQFTRRDYLHIERGIRSYGLFNSDIFLLSACMYDSTKPILGLFRTVDGGVSFKKIDFPHVERTGATFSNAKGQAWVVTHLGIFFSEDYGGTWRKIGNEVRPEISAGPCVYFKDTSRGIFSGGEWGLFLTNDNCQTIKSIQTPSSQKKLGYGEKIHNVILYDDWLIVQSSDNTTNQLWGFNQNNQVVLLDNQCKVAWTNGEKLPLDYPLSMKAVNGYFYFTFGQYLYKINQKESKHVLNYQKDMFIEVDIENRDTMNSVIWGWGQANLFQSKDLGTTWTRVKELPYPFIYSNPYCIPFRENRRFSGVNDSIISIYEFNKMKRVQFNSQTKDLTPHSIEGLFDNFLKAKITKVALSDRHLGGIVAGPATFVDYKLDKNKKRFKSAYSTGGYGYDLNRWQAMITRIKFNHHFFNYSKIDTFLRQLNRAPERHVTWSDFKMTKADKQAYFKKLKDLKKSGYQSYLYANHEDPLYYPHIDTPFLKSIALQNEFSDSLLTDIFCAAITVGGARHYLNMIIENENGETIEISDDYIYRTPKHLLWVIKYKNWEFRTADINIFKFMSALSPKSFWQHGNRPKWQTYLEIAEYLYPKRPLKD